MKRLVATAMLLGAIATLSLLSMPGMATATVPPAPPDTTPTTTVPPSTTTTEAPPVIGLGESGAAAPIPAAGPSAPLILIPDGCTAPEPASVIFVGKAVAKVADTARYRVEQIRAGTLDGYMVGDLVDIHYNNETQYLSVNDRYLVGAAPVGTSHQVLSSKVRENHAVFGGNAVIGLTDKNVACPRIDDPVRTLHVDGTDVENSMFQALGEKKGRLLLAFVAPLAIAFAIILGLVLIRWLFTLIFVTVRQVADGEPLTPSRDRRHHTPPR